MISLMLFPSARDKDSEIIEAKSTDNVKEAGHNASVADMNEESSLIYQEECSPKLGGEDMKPMGFDLSRDSIEEEDNENDGSTRDHQNFHFLGDKREALGKPDKILVKEKPWLKQILWIIGRGQQPQEDQRNQKLKTKQRLSDEGRVRRVPPCKPADRP